jgi:tetratricopeptide (TPR) repeat protein
VGEGARPEQVLDGLAPRDPLGILAGVRVGLLAIALAVGSSSEARAVRVHMAASGAKEPADAEGSWVPAEAPPPTPWARAGARGWRLCQEAERQARAFRSDEGPRGDGDQAMWRRRAQQCPHAVELLTLAARGEILEAAGLFTQIEGNAGYVEVEMGKAAVQAVVEQHREKVEQALHWLDVAIAEAGRRGHRPPREARYYRAYALTALGRVREAREALAEVIEVGDAERYRCERMAALVEMQAGDVGAALKRAQRGVVDAKSGDRPISRYIRALVLDRAGASAAAHAELVALRREGSPFARSAMESVLPVHERLFLRGLDHLANDEDSAALRFLEAYLDRSEPEEPERVLARRHLAELTPGPAPVGGP